MQHTAVYCKTIRNKKTWFMTKNELGLGHGRIAHQKTPRQTAIHCNALQRTATRCNTLRDTAAHCNTLQHIAAHCNTLYHTATHCNTMQHTTTHCITLQHTATHCTTQQQHTTTLWHINIYINTHELYARTGALILTSRWYMTPRLLVRRSNWISTNIKYVLILGMCWY